MDIYEEITREILNMKYDKVNKKVYKFILILSLFDYYEDIKMPNDCFNIDTDVNLLLPYYRLYLENSTLKKVTYANKSNKYNDNSILTDLRCNPLRHIVNNSKFFFNDDSNIRNGKYNKLSRKKSHLPNKLKIIINIEFDAEKMKNTIIKACYIKIYQITGVMLDESATSILNSVIKYDETLNSKQKSYYRTGQNLYREKLLEKYNCTCALCTINFENMLIASHAMPWRKCTSTHEKLSAHNGLLLCANHDQLFDKGYITIDPDTKEILYSPKLDGKEISTITSSNINTNKIKFNTSEYKYFKYHKDNIFRH